MQRFKELQTALSAMSDEKRLLQAELAEVRQAASNELAGLRTELASERQKEQALERDLQRAREKAMPIEEAVALCTREMEVLIRERDDWKEAYLRAYNQIEASQRQVRRLERMDGNRLYRMERLEEQCTGLQSRLSQSQEQVVAKTKESADLSQNLEASHADRDSLIEALDASEWVTSSICVPLPHVSPR